METVVYLGVVKQENIIIYHGVLKQVNHGIPDMYHTVNRGYFEQWGNYENNSEKIQSAISLNNFSV